MTTINYKNSLMLAAGGMLLLGSCAKDDFGLDSPDNIGNQGTRQAYINVNLRDVNSGTRSAGDYQPGSADEYRVDDASFYFFDANGMFVSEASVWNGGNAVATPGSNIEFNGNTVVVLKGLTSRENPTYMMTVLNVPSGFSPEATLSATSRKLVDYASSGKFVMTTSSFLGEVADGSHADRSDLAGDLYFATVLKEENFIEGDPDSPAPGVVALPVDVYVERLAAKVQVNITAQANADGFYPVTATVSGSLNNEGSTDQGVTELFVKVIGWDLNATAKKSYISKQFASNWLQGNYPFPDWNKPSDFRSFWGASATYGKSDTDASSLFDYKTYSTISKQIGSSSAAYCNENTMPENGFNTFSGIVKSYVNGRLATSVLLKTEIYTRRNGNYVKADLVRHNGILYLKNDYIAYVLNSIDLGKGNLNLWQNIGNSYQEVTLPDPSTGELKVYYSSTSSFSQIGSDYAKLVSDGGSTGSVKVVADASKFQGDYFRKTIVNGQIVFEKISANVAKSDLDNMLSAKQTAAWKAEAFTEGAMYYSIPLEHNGGNDISKEGHFGVVRNHWYQLTVSKLMKVGHGVFNPGDESTGDQGEIIIPDFPEDPSHFVQANLHILSWKLVNQNVEL